MKQLLSALVLLGALAATAQKMPKDFDNVAGQSELRDGAVVYFSGYNPDVDNNVMWALQKYWKPGGTITKKPKGNGAKAKNTSYITIDDYEQKGDDGDFFHTQFKVSSMIKVMGNTSEFDVLSIPFDNMVKKSDKDKNVIGTDKNMKLVADKALVYTMLYCSMMKNYAFPVKSLGKFYSERDKVMLEIRDKYKNTTVLIPTEILDNGISKEAFAGLKYKYEFESTENITKRIKEGSNVKNYSQLFFVKKNKRIDYVHIVDLETGDLINTGSLDGIFQSGYSYMDDKRVKSLLQELY